MQHCPSTPLKLLLGVLLAIENIMSLSCSFSSSLILKVPLVQIVAVIAIYSVNINREFKV